MGIVGEGIEVHMMAVCRAGEPGHTGQRVPAWMLWRMGESQDQEMESAYCPRGQTSPPLALKLQEA